MTTYSVSVIKPENNQEGTGSLMGKEIPDQGRIQALEVDLATQC